MDFLIHNIQINSAKLSDLLEILRIIVKKHHLNTYLKLIPRGTQNSVIGTKHVVNLFSDSN